MRCAFFPWKIAPFEALMQFEPAKDRKDDFAAPRPIPTIQVSGAMGKPRDQKSANKRGPKEKGISNPTARVIKKAARTLRDWKRKIKADHGQSQEGEEMEGNPPGIPFSGSSVEKYAQMPRSRPKEGRNWLQSPPSLPETI